MQFLQNQLITSQIQYYEVVNTRSIKMFKRFAIINYGWLQNLSKGKMKRIVSLITTSREEKKRSFRISTRCV